MLSAEYPVAACSTQVLLNIFSVSLSLNSYHPSTCEMLYLLAFNVKRYISSMRAVCSLRPLRFASVKISADVPGVFESTSASQGFRAGDRQQLFRREAEGVVPRGDERGVDEWKIRAVEKPSLELGPCECFLQVAMLVYLGER